MNPGGNPVVTRTAASEPAHTGLGSLVETLRDPRFLLVDFDFVDDAIVFSRTELDWYADKLRLSVHDLPIESLVWLPAGRVLADLPAPAQEPTINYLLHLPFCGSSFLTRHLEDPSIVLIRDPSALDAVFRKQPGERYPPTIDSLRAATLALFGRRFAGRTTVVRTAGYYPEMFGPLLSSPSHRAAVYLYARPEYYLAQVLKSALRRRQARILMATRPAWVRRSAGERLATLTDAAVAAMFWLCSAQRIVALAREDPAARVRTLDCERLFADVDATLPRVCGHYGVHALQARPEQARTIQQTHAKTGEAFTEQARVDEIAGARAAHDDEIREAMMVLQPARAAALLAELEALQL